MGSNVPFDGSKIALFLGDKLAVILRDEKPGLPFAGCWDLPGGGREGDETPLACGQRECFEELGVKVAKADVVWSRAYEEGVQRKWFFVAKLQPSVAEHVVFGDEGQRWALMSVEEFLNLQNAVPAFQERLKDYLFDGRSG